MTTALELPDRRVSENLGVCYGLVVRSMGFTGGVAASFKGLRRGEISQYTQLLEDSRRHAIDRMVENARLMGADARRRTDSRAGRRPTGERFRDPKTGKVMWVWLDGAGGRHCVVDDAT